MSTRSWRPPRPPGRSSRHEHGGRIRSASGHRGAPMSGQRLRIGEAAARAAVSVRTLRYYEELGLLTP
ncbi:MAG TPA: MerR family DNA-binding transcriptional regulator, partial [Actinomycetes bacterium]|nr:MerR family DNA-binding transcriptional regulator [Actinomycetes bacterium]